MKRLAIMLIIVLIATGAEAQRGGVGKKFITRKEPTTAALWALAPGGGQFYNGEIPKGIVFAGGGLLSFLCMLHTGTKLVSDSTINPASPKPYHDMVWIGLFGLLIVQGGGAADAYFTALRRNKELYKGKTGLYIDKFGVKLSYYF